MKSEHLGWYDMDDSIPKKSSYLVPVLPLVETTELDNTVGTIEFNVKQRAGTTGTTAATYKMKVQRFCEGNVEEWIRARRAITEIWTQNSVTAPTDRHSNVCAILRGGSLTVYEEHVEEAKNPTDDEGVVTTVALSREMVLEGLDAVAETVFPHRALQTQKQWMRRGMRKPRELSFRKTASAVGRLNNALPIFPGGSLSSKFSDTEVVELLEWSIPQTWRSKFDLAGYVPTSFDKKRLISECEAMERSEPATKKVQSTGTKDKTVPHKKGQRNKHKHGEKPSSPSTNKYYCTECGTNPSHTTEKCFKLKNAKNKAQGNLTKNSFRKEINALSKKRPKAEVLEMFALLLKQEHSKLGKTKKSKATAAKKRSILEQYPSDSSDSDESAHVMEPGFLESPDTRESKKPRVTFLTAPNGSNGSNGSHRVLTKNW